MTSRNILDIDPISLKESLKKYFKEDSTFQDYDFEGSGLNILLDILSYNTHNIMFHLNAVQNEMFIDTAQLRSNISSHCKLLGYLPKSVKSSTAIVNLSIASTTSSPITIPKGFVFTSQKDGKTFYFQTKATYQAYPENNFVIENVELVEGVANTFKYIVDTSITQSFIIPSKNVDLDTLIVTVQDFISAPNYTTYNQYNSLSTLNSSAKVFFIYENKDGFYEIQFGDGILANKLSSNNVINLNYIISSGDITNGCSTFVASNLIEGNVVSVTTVNKSFGGAMKQSNDVLRNIAIRNFQAQGRCVTTNDYKVILETVYPDAESVKVWGGEDDVQPQYGKVFIAIKPKENYSLTNSTKDYIKNVLLKPYTISGITVDIINSEYTDLLVSSTIRYNPNTLAISEGALRTAILTEIDDYATNNVNQFDKFFRFSKFSGTIDDTNDSIISNTSTIKLRNSLTVSVNSRLQYKSYFNNKVIKSTLESTGFVDNTSGKTYFIDDDGLGNVRKFYLSSGTKVYEGTLGTIDYENGIVTVTDNFVSTVEANNTIKLIVTPESNDILSKRNQILILDSNNVSLTMIQDTNV